MLRIVAGVACVCLVSHPRDIGKALIPPTQSSSVVERDSTVARLEPGPHNGGGQSTVYSFFAHAPHLGLVFRKRALHRGAAIGYHRQDEDEIYYILNGSGELTLNGVKSTIGPGTAILTRSGSSHGLRQLGDDDLVLIIAYQQPSTR